MTAITRTGLAGGLWQGLARGGETAPDLRLRHADEVVLTPEVERHPGGGWAVSFRLPIERVADGVQTFVIEDAASGEALLSETLIAGPEAGHDLRAEVDLLRAELDMLKRAFRRHCTAD
jgi:hypothetical protein